MPAASLSPYPISQPLPANYILVDRSQPTGKIHPFSIYCYPHKYECLSILGIGSYGAVFLASTTSMNSTASTMHQVALKVCKAKKEYFRQSVQENDILHYKGQTPHTVELLGSFLLNPLQSVLVLNYLQGQSLRDYCEFDAKKGQPKWALAIDDVSKIARQMFEALAALKERGIIHADLNPANIIYYEQKKKAALTDFGLSIKETDPLPDYIQTHYYRSPEVVLKVPYDASVDIWSLGCVLYEIYCGQILFPIQGTEEDKDRIQHMRMITTRIGLPPASMVAATKINRLLLSQEPWASSYTHSTFAKNRLLPPTQPLIRTNFLRSNIMNVARQRKDDLKDTGNLSDLIEQTVTYEYRLSPREALSHHLFQV